MKRAVAALAVMGIGTLMATPSQAATTVYGSAQLKYTVNATASVSIATNYTATGAQAAGASTILPSVAGNCAAGVAETSATLTFGGITPPASGYTGCYYKNAISVGVFSNDSAGVKLYEYLDTLTTGTQVCIFPLNATPTASPSTSGAAGNPAAYGASCPTVNGIAGVALTAVGAASGGTAGTFGAAGNPGGTDVTATPQYTAYAAGPSVLYSSGASAPPAGWNFIGEDLQLNVSPAAASGNVTNIITFALIAS